MEEEISRLKKQELERFNRSYSEPSNSLESKRRLHKLTIVNTLGIGLILLIVVPMLKKTRTEYVEVPVYVEESDPFSGPTNSGSPAPTIAATIPVDSSSGNVVKMPNLISEAIIVGDGKYIVFRFQTISGLMIYNTLQRDFIGSIRLGSENFIYTAGGETVLIYFPENNLLQTWNLVTGEKLLTKLNPRGEVVVRMTMGHANGRQALIRYANGTQKKDLAAAYLLNTETLEIEPVINTSLIQNAQYNNNVQQRADGNLFMVAEWRSANSPTGLGLFTITSEQVYQNYQNKSVGYILAGDDGLLYTQTGQIYTSELRNVNTIEGQALIPGLGGTLFLGITKGGSIQVYASGSQTPLVSYVTVPGFGNQFNDIPRDPVETNLLPLDRRVMFAPELGCLILIPMERDRLIYYDFDLKGALDNVGIDYLFVTSMPETRFKAGEIWTYRIETLSNADGVSFEVEYGPEGMRVSENGLVTWAVPQAANEIEQVVILVENSNGESTYHNFNLRLFSN